MSTYRVSVVALVVIILAFICGIIALGLPYWLFQQKAVVNGNAVDVHLGFFQACYSGSCYSFTEQHILIFTRFVKATIGLEFVAVIGSFISCILAIIILALGSRGDAKIWSLVLSFLSGLCHLTGFLVWTIGFVVGEGLIFENFRKAVGFWLALVAGILCFIHVVLVGLIKEKTMKDPNVISLQRI